MRRHDKQRKEKKKKSEEGIEARPKIKIRMGSVGRGASDKRVVFLSTTNVVGRVLPQGHSMDYL